MKLLKQYCFGTFCDTKFLFAWIVKPTKLQNVQQSLLDQQALSNPKFINPILRNCNFKEARFRYFSLFLRKIVENQPKMLQSSFIQIAISQDWVYGFWISQSLWVKEALVNILKLSRFHNSCKQKFCATKCPKTVLFEQFHICMTVGTICVWTLDHQWWAVWRIERSCLL